MPADSDGGVSSDGAAARIPRLALLLGVTLGTACASGGPGAGAGPAPALPTTTVYEAGFTNQPSSVRDTVLAETRSRVWAALPDVLQELGVEASTRDERAFVIGNQGWRPTAIHGTRLSAFLRCGAGLTGPNADSYDVRALLLVQLEARSASETLVRTVVDAYARPRTSAGAEVRCASAGTLEARILRLIGDRLAAGPDAVGITAPGEMLSGRLPRVGDLLRVACAGPADQLLVGQGEFVGATAGTVTLRLSATRPGEAFPAARVRSVQIRERHSRVGWGALIGGVLGLVTGGYLGHSGYDPDGLSHYGQGTVMTIGAVAGAISGALVGAIGGWLVAHEEWIDVPSAWWEREAPGALAPQESSAGTTSCPSVVD